MKIRAFAALVALSAAGVSAPAAFAVPVYVTQDRVVSASTHDSPSGPATDEELIESTNFDTVDATATASNGALPVAVGFLIQNVSSTMHSELGSGGISISGHAEGGSVGSPLQQDNPVDGVPVVYGDSQNVISFSLDAPHHYTLSFDTILNPNPQSFFQEVEALIQLIGPGTDILELLSPGDQHFLKSGILGPGDYTFYLGTSLIVQDGAGSMQFTGGLALDTRTNAIPLPPAVWSGLATMIGAGGVGAFRRMRRA